MTEYTKLTGKEINKLKPGDLVAWREQRWKPIGPNTKWVEAQLAESPIRCYHVIFVQLDGLRTPIEKNRLYKPPVVVEIDVMHEVWNYDS